MPSDDLFNLIDEFRRQMDIKPKAAAAAQEPAPVVSDKLDDSDSSDKSDESDESGRIEEPITKAAASSAVPAASASPAPLGDLFAPKPYRVGELTDVLREIIETNLGRVEVEGEISNWKRHSSGHCYFSLKDDRAVLPCVMWRGQAAALKFAPENGQKVVASGRIGIYEKQGAYQLYADSLRPAGLGDLHRRFMELRDRLEREGLFDEARKKPLPFLPRTIAIVTSPTGAAIRDILNVLRRRFANVRVLIYPVSVQGERAAPEIAAAIRRLDAWRDRLALDVMIVARGGGSMEDLWAFNEEAVARAVADCRVPVISGVGHEIDFTICDFAADVRAPTPSAAAELVVQNQADLQRRVAALSAALVKSMGHAVAVRRERVERLRSHYALRHPAQRLREFAQRLDELDERLRLHMRAGVRDAAQRLARAGEQMRALGPDHVLARGYSIVRAEKSGAIIRDASALAPDDAVQILFHRGAADAAITATRADIDSHKSANPE